MKEVWDNLPNYLKVLLVITFSALMVGGVISIGNGERPPELTETIKPPENDNEEIKEKINVRIRVRNEKSEKPISKVKIELDYLAAPFVGYTDSNGYIDVKIPKTDTIKIYLSKESFKDRIYQLDPKINIPSDRNITYYLPPNHPEEDISGRQNIKIFKEEFGSFDKSKKFIKFIRDNKQRIVYFDTRAETSNLKMDEDNLDDYYIKYFGVWHECHDSFDTSQKPEMGDCITYDFVIEDNEKNTDKDSVISSRGRLRINGYFAVPPCSPMYQGIIVCTLRPVKVEDTI